MSTMATINLLWRSTDFPTGGAGTLFLVLKATGLLLIAGAIALAMRRTSAGSRHLVWLAALASLLLLPALAAWGPLQLRILPAPIASTQRGATLPDQSGSVLDAPVTQGGAPNSSAPAQTPAAGSATTSTASLSAGTILFAIWLAVVLMLFGWLMHGWYLVHRIVRRARPLEEPEWNTPLYEIADRLGLERAPRLLRSTDVHMPFACGLLRSTIVLPAESDGWSSEQRTAVLIHELGHVRRHDLVGHTLGRIACALYWFHPLVWTAARRLRDESERACDDLALHFGARPSEYAEHLLEIVTTVRHHQTPSVALAMAHRKEFEGRMLAILDPQLHRAGPNRRQAASVLGFVGVLALLVGAAAPVPRAAEPAPLSVAEKTLPEAPTSPPADHEQRPLTATSTHRDVKVDTHVNTNVNSRTSPAPNPSPAASLLARANQGTDDDKIDLLAKLLRTDTDASVRRVAAWGLKPYTTSKVAADALQHALTTDASGEVRRMAAWAMAEGDTLIGVGALETAARDDKSDGVREMAIWALGNNGVTEAAGMIGERMSTEPSAWVRATAAWALGQLDLRTAPKGLIAALSDTNDDVRYKASWALSQIGDKGALPALKKAIARETFSGAMRAQLRALTRSGVDPADLASLATSEHPEIRAIVVRALAGDLTVSIWPWPWPRPIPSP